MRPNRIVLVCGDLLEHLNNPWKVAEALRNHLKNGGLFIASTPNINNWAVIYEILKGRWDYVPFSILSGAHIRFFTRQTFIELFEDAGYRIKGVFVQGFDIPPKGAEFIKAFKRASCKSLNFFSQAILTKGLFKCLLRGNLTKQLYTMLFCNR